MGIGCNRLGSVGILVEKYTVTEARFSSLSVSRLCQGLKWQVSLLKHNECSLKVAISA